ncbi:hypothetical protein M758_6G179500 [Ceratodon purpureus]|uniref:Uncharacterized protein n=1 Tax=Ceratodon purpureus TaxID=3225 RepID=A0A8T0HH71_CERPU|nr:hypothetical protein KC19_6G186500 [Ceratodon purpureus]KAG0614470.1 hypothetical protein M758_6G179500 [Ceratodon purpureus]
MAPFTCYTQTRRGITWLLRQSRKINANVELSTTPVCHSRSSATKEAGFTVCSAFTVGFDKPINISDEGLMPQAMNRVRRTECSKSPQEHGARFQIFNLRGLACCSYGICWLVSWGLSGVMLLCTELELLLPVLWFGSCPCSRLLRSISDET